MKVPSIALLSIIMMNVSAQDTTNIIVADSVIHAPTDSVIATKQIVPESEIYRLNPWFDVPVTAAGTGWSLFAFTKIYSKDPSTQEQILALRKEDINSFDRSAAGVYHLSAKNASDYLFYGSMPLPVLLLTGKNTRKDIGKIGLLYLESMSITGLLYTGATYLTNRYRPLAYNPKVPIETRMRGGAKNSFFAGHVALVATSVFFTSKVYADYHPHSPLRWVFYTAAAGVTITQGYLRYRGGQHFPSDIILGTIVGTCSGLLVPHFHKVKKVNDRLTFIPQSNGISFIYRI